MGGFRSTLSAVSEPTPSLLDLGWRDAFRQAFEALPESEHLTPARVVLQQRGRYNVATASGEYAAELDGRMRKAAAAAAELPCVGDWVALRSSSMSSAPPGSAGATPAVGTICALLPRLTKFSRRAAGPEHAEQVLAANIDTVFIAMGLDGDFNLRRMERYLTVAAASGARAVVLLTKSDLCAADDLAARTAEVRAIAPGVDVVGTSVVSAQGLQVLDPFLGRGQTIAIFGSSGVGKSTLVNALLQQEVLRTGEVRPSDSRGRHTTTQRQLFRVRTGALVIDTPGIRELQLWDATAGLDVTFADVASVAATCRFGDCRHEDEPGCAVVAAVHAGGLPAERVASFKKLKGEQQASEGRHDPEVARRRKRADASVTRLVRRKHQEN